MSTHSALLLRPRQVCAHIANKRAESFIRCVFLVLPLNTLRSLLTCVNARNTMLDPNLRSGWSSCSLGVGKSTRAHEKVRTHVAYILQLREVMQN